MISCEELTPSEGMTDMKRIRLLSMLAVCLGLALWHLDTTARGDADEDKARYTRIAGAVRELLDRTPQALTPSEQRTLRDAQQQLSTALANWNNSNVLYSTAAEKICNPCQSALARILPTLDGAGATERITASGLPMNAVRRDWPSGSGVVILRLESGGSGQDPVPEFVVGEIDLAMEAPAPIRLPPARVVYAMLFCRNGAPGARTVPVQLAGGDWRDARFSLIVETPAAGELAVEIVDEKTDKPTAAVAGLYAADNDLKVPPQALSFDDAGFAYRRGHVRPYNVRYWPGDPQQRHVFFVDGGFSFPVPEGKYTLRVGKGFEYVPVTQEVVVRPGQRTSQCVRLKRWIDMPARGWMSGDAHVHYQRSGDASNRTLMLWTQAEDVHVANVVRMGDARKTYFEQYAFGAAGRFLAGPYALVPGQEDPRTNYIGHTLHMNLQRPIRFPDRYYLYDLVADEAHRQGAISGFVHVYQPTVNGFFVRLGMTLNIVRDKVDTLEICEFGDIGDRLYYEFLNLGFKLTATAGSDVPWGNSIGQSRMYAYTGKRTDPDAWFEAVKAGHTFVTSGPMLELTVNGKVPGSEIELQPGEKVEIRATASGDLVAPRYLDIVAQGEVLASKKAAPGERTLAVELTAPITGSTWIAARCNSAHTTPVYIRVGGKPFWKVRAVPELVEARLQQLRDLERFAEQGPGMGGEGGYDMPDAGFAPQIPLLKERIAESRRLYLEMSDKAKAELRRAP